MSQLDIELAEELLRKGKYADAVERLRQLLSAEPEDAELRGRLAEAYRLSGNTERAFHHFNKAAAIYTRRSEVLGACRMLKSANTVSPNEPDILFRMAECMKLLGNKGEFEQVLRQLVTVARASGDRRRVWALDELAEIYPDDLDLAIAHATSLGEAGRVEDAIDAWKKVSARLDARGDDIAPLLRQAAALAADKPEVGVDLAEILLVHGKARDALAVLVPYYEKYPDDVRVLEALLRALEHIGATDKIIPARIELVKARTKLGQRGLAVTEITKLLKQAPTEPLALEVCAHACAAFGIIGEATRLWFQLARIYDQLGRTAGRDRALFACLKANPNHEQALEMGARVLEAAGRSDEAASLARRLAEIRRARPDSGGSLPAAPLGGTDEVAATMPPAASSSSPSSLPPPPPPASDPEAPSWKTKSSHVLLDEDVVEVVDNDQTPQPHEAMPIHQNPWAADLDVTKAAPVEPQPLSGLDLDAPTGPMPQRRRADEAPIYDPFFTGDQVTEHSLEEEVAVQPEEVTSRMMEVDEEELAALRAEFGSDDQPTWVELETQSSVTPAGGTPLRAEEFEERRQTRSRASDRLVSDLQDEIAKSRR